MTLIDPSAGPHPDITIVIERNRIIDVGPSSSVVIPRGAVVRDAHGQFAIPGLWDMHVHISQISEDSIPLLLANGVTAVRDMGSAADDVALWKRVRSTGGLAPRVFWPGLKLDGEGDPTTDNLIVKTPDEGRRAVDRLHAMHVDFIKVHNRLSREVFEAIADQCRKDGLAFAGHATGDVSPLVAVAAGQRTIEHGREMLSCSVQERAQIAAAGPAPQLRFCAPVETADQILPAMARAGTWFTPTLVSWRGHGLTPEAASHLDGMQEAPPTLQRWWRLQMEGEEVSMLEQQLMAEFGPLTASAARAGVHLLTGSDAGDPYVVPGFALQDELQLFVQAGVSPLQTIRSATLEPARALGVADTTGSIEPGKTADIVLLAADPLADITNTRRITAVILDGRWLAADELAALRKPLRHSN